MSDNYLKEHELEKAVIKCALPMGMTEFNTWSERLIALAGVPTSNIESLKKILAEMIMHYKANEDYVEDEVFIKGLRRAAANEVAFAVLQAFNQKKLAAIQDEQYG